MRVLSGPQSMRAVSFNAASVRHLVEKMMRVFVLVEVAPNGSQSVQKVFQAESLDAARAYAEQQNTTELDKYVRRFRIAGAYTCCELDFDPEEGRYFLGL